MNGRRNLLNRKEKHMNRNALLLELLVSGFFAIACLRARVAGRSDVAMKPRDLLRLTDRLERLRRTRWQWCSMVLIIVAIRMQTGIPLIVELTAALQFVVFLALPVAKVLPIRAFETSRKGISRKQQGHIRTAKVG
jgi:hypothetical protein